MRARVGDLGRSVEDFGGDYVALPQSAVPDLSAEIDAWREAGGTHVGPLRARVVERVHADPERHLLGVHTGGVHASVVGRGPTLVVNGDAGLQQGATREELLDNLRDALEEALEMNRQDARAAAAGAFEEVSLAS